MLYVFLGAREPRIHDEARIALGLGEADDDLSLTRLDGAETSLVDMAQACGAIDMFGGRRKVLLTNAQALVASDKKVMPWLAEFARAGSAAPCDLAALAYLDLGDRRSGSRVRAFSKLEDAGAQVRQVRPLDERRAAQFARRLAQRLGVRLDDAAAERLVEIVTPDAGLLAREVDKLAAYAGFTGTLNVDDVDAASATIGEHRRWDYINARLGAATAPGAGRAPRLAGSAGAQADDPGRHRHRHAAPGHGQGRGRRGRRHQGGGPPRGRAAVSSARAARAGSAHVAQATGAHVRRGGAHRPRAQIDRQRGKTRCSRS